MCVFQRDTGNRKTSTCEGLQWWFDLVYMKSKEQKGSVFGVCNREREMSHSYDNGRGLYNKGECDLIDMW